MPRKHDLGFGHLTSWSTINRTLEISPVPLHFLSISVALRKDYPLGFMAPTDPARILQTLVTSSRNSWKALQNMRDQSET